MRCFWSVTDTAIASLRMGDGRSWEYAASQNQMTLVFIAADEKEGVPAMRADDAKRLPLDRILALLGHQPVKTVKAGRELWYHSPFREEKTASLHISHVYHTRLGWIWIWKDFGDIGGNVIAFTQRYYGLSEDDVSGALKKLDGLGLGSVSAALPSPAPVRPQPKGKAEVAHPFTEVQITPLESPALLDYLARRGITAELAQRYLGEVHYRFEEKPFSALAFGNDHGGYEMRSTGRFKGTLPPKAITLLHPEKLASSSAVAVFEGFMDYLSALTYYGKTEADTPVLILNSAAMEKAAVEKIQSLGASKVHLYLDRDETGKEMTGRLQAQLAGLEVIDQSKLYVGHKDFNAFLMARQKANRKEFAR